MKFIIEYLHYLSYSCTTVIHMPGLSYIQDNSGLFEVFDNQTNQSNFDFFLNLVQDIYFIRYIQHTFLTLSVIRNFLRYSEGTKKILF